MKNNEKLLDHLQQINRDRRPDLLMWKYRAMRENAFRFFRATPSLFYQNMHPELMADAYPVCWSCGDLHLENFGSFRGSNKLVYFDINDFDEALLAPATVDLTRLVASLFVAAPLLRHSPETSRQLAYRFLTTYRQLLLLSKPRSIERQTSKGILNEFLTQVARRSRKELINRLTHGHGRKRQLRLIKDRILPLPKQEREVVWSWLKSALAEGADYRLRDVKFRMAGTSSIGLNRYVALVESASHKLHLLDIKATRSSVAEPYLNVSQPCWPNPANRIVALQNRLQDVPPANLWPLVGLDGEFFAVRSLQPQADRLDLTNKRIRGKQRLGKLIDTMAQLTASAHLRSGGHQGSAIADELITFANKTVWVSELVAWAEAYAQQVFLDFDQFQAAFDAGWPGSIECK
ncbi:MULTISPECIES: DUF2252 family protein [unclassified Spirosoma]|uniref:DUF2252 domain-containing protein n=1 Tax=unclassified Spirosoma TaxID=2621999 RepID=UPI000966B166|nr:MULTISPECIES: DUF2252 family protein [unclassified Spirosoma]MBN8822937.1 DUF2252 family protein [Spirosoma sp.]OJW80122.1 MAG: hypothetical protein BGO59_02650 [Spirosoma sp. 48-14]